MTERTSETSDLDDLTDRQGHNELYAYHDQDLPRSECCREFMAWYAGEHLSAFCAGGTTKGYVRGLATRRLLDRVASGKSGSLDDVRILDAGCGRGELSLYLACLGLSVIGVDVSEVGCLWGSEAAKRLDIDDRCDLIPANLAYLPLPDNCIDFVIGHASLHHFIKYSGVSTELYRVMKPGAKGFFADSFGENPVFRIFHDKERMERLGDVPLNRELIKNFFRRFQVDLYPTDWFVMLDKLYLRYLPQRMIPLFRRLSRLHFRLDRWIPERSGLALALSGSVVTEITKPERYRAA